MVNGNVKILVAGAITATCIIGLAGCKNPSPKDSADGNAQRAAAPQCSACCDPIPSDDKTLEGKIVVLVRKYYPDADIKMNKGQLTLKRSAMIYTLHSTYKTGEVRKETYQTEGPNQDGFVIEIQRIEGPYQGAAMLPSSGRNEYWNSYIDAPPTEDGKGHYFINIKYRLLKNDDFLKELWATLPKSRS